MNRAGTLTTTRWVLPAACLLSVVLGLLYVAAVRPGTPYDEPSHFTTVEYIARHGALPVMGHAGVTYEAQQAPIYYLVAAGVLRIASAAGRVNGFYAVRLLGLLVLPVFVLLASRLVSLATDSASIRASTTFFTAASAPILAVAASVQNDTTAIVIAMVAMAMVAGERGAPSTRRGAWVGLVIGLALMAKLTTIFLVLVIPGWWAWRYRWAAVRPLVALVAAIAIVSGWWFARNVVLYHEPLGITAAVRYYPGAFAGPVPLTAHTALHVARAVLGYYWASTEYYRNLFNLAVYMRIPLVALTGLAFAGCIVRFRARQPVVANLAELRMVQVRRFYSLCVLTAFIVWFVSYAASQTPPRYTYPVYFVFPAVLVYGMTNIANGVHLRPVLGIGALIAFALVVNTYMLIHVHEIGRYAFEIFPVSG